MKSRKFNPFIASKRKLRGDSGKRWLIVGGIFVRKMNPRDSGAGSQTKVNSKRVINWWKNFSPRYDGLCVTGSF